MLTLNSRNISLLKQKMSNC